MTDFKLEQPAPIDQEPEGVIDYTPTQVPGTFLDERTAKVRAEKYSKAFGSLSNEEIDGIKSSLQNGVDDEVRSQLMTKAAEIDNKTRNAQFLKMLYQDGVTLEEAEKILKPTDINTMDVNSFLEKKYSENIIADAFRTTSPEEQSYSPKVILKEDLDKATNLNATREVALRFKEDLENKVKKMGTLPFVGEVALSVVPFAMSYIQGKKEAIKDYDDVLLGQNLDKQFSEIWAMSPEKAAIKIKERVEEISKVSYTAALDWVDRLISGGAVSRYVDNVFSGLDATLLIGPAKASSRAARNFIGAITSPGANSVTAATAAGNLGHAARMEAMNKLFGRVQTEVPRQGSFFPFMENLVSIINPQQILTGGSQGLSANRTARLLDNLEINAAKIIDYVTDGVRNTERLEGNVLQVAEDQARTLASLQYPGIAHQVIGASARYSTLGKNFNLEVLIGNTQGLTFNTALEAEIMAKNFLFLKEYKVVPIGDKHVISIVKPLDETSDAVRDALGRLIETNDPTPQTLANRFLNGVRSNDYTLSRGTNTDLKKAAYSAANISDLMVSMAKPIGVLKKQEKREFNAFVDAQKTYVNPLNREVGRFSRDVNEFEQEWFSLHNKFPSERQTEAYFAYRQINDADYMLRNLNIYQTKVREGIQSFSFDFGGLKWKQSKVPDIEGKFVTRLPWEVEGRPFSILVAGENLADVQRYTSGHVGRGTYTLIEGLLATGNYKIINLTTFGEETLRASPVVGSRIPPGKIDYVLVPTKGNLRTANIPLKQIPYREGYHMILDDGTYMVRQAHVAREAGRTIYYGDRNIVQARTARQAMEISRELEAIRPIVGDIIAGRRNITDLHNALQSRNLPFSAQEIMVQFRTHLDPDTPILFSRKGENLEDTHKISNGYQNFTRHSEDPHNPLRSLDMSYALEKNEPISQVRQVGVNGGVPVWNIEPAKYLDPMTAIQRSSEKLLRDVVLKDMRINASERFLAEFGHLLEGNLQDLRRNPLGTLENAVFKTKGVTPEEIAAAKNFQRATLEFMGIKGDYERTFEHLHQRLSDSIFERFGDRGVDVLGNIERHIPTNPVRFLRAASVNMKFGFFNVGQLFMQGQGVVHIAAVEGLPQALHASGAYTLMKYGNGNMNAQLLQTLGDRAQAIGWGTRNHFEEMYREAHNSGFLKVGGSYTGIDNFLNPNLFDSTIGKVMDHSKVFFKAGEEFVRGAAYAAAYRNWREANPTATFTRIAQDSVLRRADFLSVHMSSASNAAWNKGFMSVPTQFMSYQARLMEQIWGGGFTAMERAHILATYGAVYGVPVGVGGALLGGVWPVHETIKQYAIENGIDFDSNIVFKSFNDGLGSLITEFLVGNEQNVSERFGPGGNSMFRDIYNNARGVGRKTYGEILAGAGGNTVINVVKSMNPLFYSFYRTTTGKDAWPLQTTDFLDFAREISAVNNGIKGYYAVALGQYYTRQNTTIVKDASAIEGIMTALMGTAPDRVDRYYDVMLASSELKLAREYAIKNASLQYERALEAFSKGDEDAGAKFLKKAQIYMMPLDPVEQGKVFSSAVSKNINDLEEVEARYAMKNKSFFDSWFKKHERN